MRYFFSPAIVLMQRLGYTLKFSLLWLMSLVAIVVVVLSLYSSLHMEIRRSQQELDGIALAVPVSKAIQILQQHRGLSASLLGGNAEMRNLRAAKEQEVAETFASLEGKLPDNLRASEEWRSIKGKWEQLSADGLKWTMDENFARHTRLIDQLLLFKVVVSGEYVLPLDSQVDTSYLIDVAINKLPVALEHLGQIRAHGTVILGRKEASDAEKLKMNTLIAVLNDDIKFIKINFDKVGGFNPDLQSSLALVSDDIGTLTREISKLVGSEIIDSHFSIAPEKFYLLTTEMLNKGYAQMYDDLLPTIQSLIRARIARAEQALFLSVGIAFLLFLAVVYLSIGIYFSTVDSIESLAGSARAFASGDLTQRVDLDVSDELRQVGASFNEMADGFGTLLSAREEAEARLRAIIESAMDAVVQMNMAGVITGWNAQAAAMFGWTKDEALGQTLSQLIIPGRYRAEHQNGMEKFLRTGIGPVLNARIEVQALRRDGREFPAELSITAIKTSINFEFNGFIRDITKRKESEEIIWKQANFDMLTNLPNRRMFHDRLGLEIKRAERSGTGMALLFIDLDRFKEINDTLGHGIGDLLLVEAAHRISDCIRESDSVARLGGDEFVVLLPGLDVNKVDQIAESILRKLAEPFKLGDEVAYVSASIGITLYPHDATQIDCLIMDADQAMYAAKKTGRNRISYFTPELQENALNRRRLINDLHSALACHQLMVYYQPIVDMATGQIHKAEALLRWQHPAHGLISPSEFIPLAEETGLIVDIGDWVFREAARQVKRCQTLSGAEFQISVNGSPVQLRNAGGLCQTWLGYMRELELPGQSVVLEITEGLLLDATGGVREELLDFHRAGIQISLDDFGTGYSSLSYIEKFDIDYLKIDQSFTRHLAPGSRYMALSEAIIVMAHKLGLKVIAEGVETELQRDLLVAVGCDYAQGYLFAKPLPTDEFEKMLVAQ